MFYAWASWPPWPTPVASTFVSSLLTTSVVGPRSVESVRHGDEDAAGAGGDRGLHGARRTAAVLRHRRSCPDRGRGRRPTAPTARQELAQLLRRAAAVRDPMPAAWAAGEDAGPRHHPARRPGPGPALALPAAGLLRARARPIGQVFTAQAAGRAGPAASGRWAWGPVSVSAYVRPGDRLTFYEIDPLVDRVATDPTHFTYTTEVRPGARGLCDGRRPPDRGSQGSPQAGSTSFC